MKNTLSALLSLRLLTTSGKFALIAYGAILYLASSLNDSYTNVIVWMVSVPIMIVIITHNAMFKASPADSLTNLEFAITQNQKVSGVVKTITLLLLLNIVFAFISNTNAFTQKESFDGSFAIQAIALLALHLIMIIPFGTAFEIVTCMTPSAEAEDKSVTSISESYSIINSGVKEVAPFGMGIGTCVCVVSVPVFSAVGTQIGHNSAVTLMMTIYTLVTSAIAINYLGSGLTDKEYQELKVGKPQQETATQ